MAKLGLPIHSRFKLLLEKAEKEGWGYHEMMIAGARLCKNAGVEPEFASDLMEKAGDDVSRRTQAPGEVRRVVNFIYGSEYEFRPHEMPKIGTKIEPALISEYTKGGSIQDLQNASGPIPQTSEEILSHLYSDDALLHLSPHTCQAKEIKTRKEWCESDLTNQQYICPATLKSRDMGRTKENVELRQFIVWESDRDGLAFNWDAQAGIISHLSKSIPLKMVCFSGNKSLHAWFDISAVRQDLIQNFITLCVQVAADPMTLRKAQVVRTPWAIRADNGRTQKTIYYAN